MITELVFLILPILMSGLTFIIFLKYNRGKLNAPLDFGLKWKGKRLFGENKTIKGPIFMGIFVMIFGFFIYTLLKNNINIKLSNAQILTYFLLIGLTYSIGELPNSFIKRQLSIPSGKSHSNKIIKFILKLTDTFDSLITVGIAYALLFNLRINTILIAILIGGFLHLTTDQLMIKLNLK